MFVEERIRGRLQINQPAGHVEPGETLLDAVCRETLEETAWTFLPESMIGVIQGSAATGKQHRIITLSFNWPDAAELQIIADAAAAELSENATFYFQQLGNDGAGITMIDPPGVGPVGGGARDQIELPLRVEGFAG